MKQLLILLLVIGSIIMPYDINGLSLTNAQSLSSTIDLNDNNQVASVLETLIFQLDQQGVLSLNDFDTADWDVNSLTQKSLSFYDKKIITQLLPSLVGSDGLALRKLVVDRIRRGYTGKENKSWETTGATNTSAYHYGKAVALSGVGTTSCVDTALFPRNLDPEKTLWVHNQNSVADKTTQRWPFGRAFDTVARQFFWIEARSFTNRPITALTWSSFLQQVAKGEVEERFDLTPGSLANTAVSELGTATARARLARALTIPDLPTTTSESQFYELLGRRIFEEELNLPRNSFNGTTRRQIAQQIGFRVLEEQLSMPEDTTNDLLVGSNDFFTSSPRFLQLKNRLEERGENYIDPRIGFSLPPEEYFATGEGQGIYQRLIAGDPDAFAIVGSYFLADSLELSPDDTKTVLVNVNQATDDLPDLPIEKARPIDPNLPADRLLAGPIDQQPALFETIGRTLVPQMKSQLPQLNESVLRAISTNNKTPDYTAVMSLLTDTDKRNAALQKLAVSTAADANYYTDSKGQTPGFTIAALRQRGMELLSKTIEVPVADLQQLETSETDTENATTTQSVADTIDSAMGWPLGTARKLTLRGAQDAADDSILTDGELLQIGASMLWDRLGLPETYKAILNRYYFSSNLTDLTPLPNNDPEQEATDPDAGEIVEEIDEAVTALSIPAQDNTTIKAFTETLNITPDDVQLLLAGRMYAVLPRLTIALIGSAMNLETENFRQQLLLSLYNHDETTYSDDDFASLKNSEFLQPSFGDNIVQALADKDNYRLWDTFQREAVYQWNVFCPDKAEETRDAIASLVDYLVSLPTSDSSTSKPPTRPYQILTYNTSILSEETEAKIKTAYPDADGDTYKWGVYANPRDWDHIYIGY